MSCYAVTKCVLPVDEPGAVQPLVDQPGLAMNSLVYGLCLSLLLVASSMFAHAADGPKGSLVIMGGSERYDTSEFWTEIVSLAGGPGAKIAILPTASSDPQRVASLVIDPLQKAGAETFVLPITWSNPSESAQQAANDPELAQKVLLAQGVFMVGGSQSRIVRALYNDDGSQTEVLKAMFQSYEAGGVIAGTSAGAAVMSRVMYRDAESVLKTMLEGVRMGKEIDRGLGFLPDDWFVDQHCLVRGRFARALVAMQHQGFPFGLGIDENTGVVIRRGHDLRVIGHKGVIVMDLSAATTDTTIEKFNLQNVRLTYLDRGDRFDLTTREVTPSLEKLEEQKIEPFSPDFRPFFRKQLFFNDILANTTVADLMGKLIDNKFPTAIGLAFDGMQARTEPVDGFEFLFTRDEESVGWYTERFGGDDYTVLNIRLDIRPIRITGPLYE